MNYPAVKENEIIYIHNIKCIVRKVYDVGSSFGVGEVIFERDKPASHDFDWKDGRWVFPERPDYGGYVHNCDPFLKRLRQS